MLLPEAWVPKARAEDDDVHWVASAVGVVGTVEIDGVGHQVVIRGRSCCEIRYERGMGHTGETAVASLTT